MTAADAPAASATRRAGRAGWRLPVLGLLLVSAVAVPTWRMEAAAEASRERAAGFREDAEAARAAREEVDRLDALGSNGGGSGSLLPLLAEATRRLPDDTWVTRFAYRPGELELAGYSASAASVPRLLAESGLVTGAELTAPVSFDARTGGERFVVRARGGDR
jgi:general secretion pathway protein L